MKNGENIPTDAPETWLRQTLGDYRPEAPADAWQRLAPHLPQRKSRRPIALWLWWSVAGVAAVCALFGFFQQTPKQDIALVLTGQMPPTARFLDKLSNNGLDKNDSPNALEKTDSSPAVYSSEKSFSARNSLQNATTSAFFSKNIPPAATVLPEEQQPNGLDTAATFGEKENLGLEQPPQMPEPKPSDNQPERLTTKPFAPLAQTYPQPNIHFATPEFRLEKATRNRRFWLGIEASPAFFMPKNMNGAHGMHGHLSFPESHRSHGVGWQAGISVATVPLKNWRVALGIQYLRQTNESAHSATLRLMDGVCLNPYDPGLKEYEFRYAVVSGGEQSDLRLRLQQQDIGSMMPHDEPFTLEMKTVHRSTVWRVPLSLERRFGTGKWRGFVRGGTVVDFLGNSTARVTHFTEICHDLCFQNGHVPNARISTPSGVSFGWLAGAGIERQIFNRAALRFEPFMVRQKGTVQCGLNFGLLFSH